MQTEVHHHNKTFSSINYAEKELVGREFDQCNFQQVDFSNCKIQNCIFSDCVLEDCNLSLAQLVNTGLSNVKFKNCKLLGVDFIKVRDFSFSVSFENCILDYASFSRKKLKKAKFVVAGLQGLLEKYNLIVVE